VPPRESRGMRDAKEKGTTALSFVAIGASVGILIFITFAFVIVRTKNASLNHAPRGDRIPLQSNDRKSTKKERKKEAKDEYAKLCEADRGKNVISNTRSAGQKNLHLNR